MLEIYLPLFHFHLLAVVLLDEILQYFPETLRIRLQCRHNILHRSLNENAIYHPEAFPVCRKRFEGFKDKLCVYTIAVSGGFWRCGRGSKVGKKRKLRTVPLNSLRPDMFRMQ